jgi:carboxypeptidase Taq
MTTYEKYCEALRKIADVNYASAVLQWDQEVNMPEAGAEARARQLATLSGISHELSVEQELGDWLATLNQDAALHEKQRRNVKESLRNYTDRKKYTTDFVVEMSKTISESFQAWQRAKKENNFKLFGPLLEKLVDLKLRECEMLGYTEHPYDAMLNQYEPGLKASDVDTLFTEVRSHLVPFVKKIFAKQVPDDSFTQQHFKHSEQWDFGIGLLKSMGYDFKSGRQDISSHPFTTNFSSRDVRVTTRINEHDLKEMIWSCIHEGGHALYEQGLPDEDYGLPSGEYLSLGIHESQSRLWENNVGRSLPYWNYHYPELKKRFPQQLASVSLQDMYRSMNKVEPSLIRTNADELTYHFHIMIRFEIEKGLMEKTIRVQELPEYWNARYMDYLGIEVPSDSKGVLQDVHWSHGSFGYFPTYSLGSFYAAQFMNKAEAAIPGLLQLMEQGDTTLLLKWLREKIHIHGRQFTAAELCKMVTGETLSFSYFMDYAKMKYGAIYEL